MRAIAFGFIYRRPVHKEFERYDRLPSAQHACGLRRRGPAQREQRCYFPAPSVRARSERLVWAAIKGGFSAVTAGAVVMAGGAGRGIAGGETAAQQAVPVGPRRRGHTGMPETDMSHRGQCLHARVSTGGRCGRFSIWAGFGLIRPALGQRWSGGSPWLTAAIRCRHLNVWAFCVRR